MRAPRRSRRRGTDETRRRRAVTRPAVPARASASISSARRPLAERLGGDLGLELADDLLRAAQLQQRGGPFLDRTGAQLNQSSHLRGGELLARELRVRRSSPQPERLVERAQRDLRLVQPTRARPAPAPRTATRPTSPVATRSRYPGGRVSRRSSPSVAAQPGQQCLERVRRARRRFVTPQHVDEAITRDHLVGVDQQRREHAALLGAPQPNRLAVAHDLQWAQHTQRSSPPGRPPTLQPQPHAGHARAAITQRPRSDHAARPLPDAVVEETILAHHPKGREPMNLRTILHHPVRVAGHSRRQPGSCSAGTAEERFRLRRRAPRHHPTHAKTSPWPAPPTPTPSGSTSIRSPPPTATRPSSPSTPTCSGALEAIVVSNVAAAMRSMG